GCTSSAYTTPFGPTRRARYVVNHPPPAPMSPTRELSAMFSASITRSGCCHTARSGASSAPRSAGGYSFPRASLADFAGVDGGGEDDCRLHAPATITPTIDNASRRDE